MRYTNRHFTYLLSLGLFWVCFVLFTLFARALGHFLCCIVFVCLYSVSWSIWFHCQVIYRKNLSLKWPINVLMEMLNPTHSLIRTPTEVAVICYLKLCSYNRWNIMDIFFNLIPWKCLINLHSWHVQLYTQSHTHIHSILTATIPGKPGLASFPLNFPSPLYS